MDLFNIGRNLSPLSVFIIARLEAKISRLKPHHVREFVRAQMSASVTKRAVLRNAREVGAGYVEAGRKVLRRTIFM